MNHKIPFALFIILFTFFSCNLKKEDSNTIKSDQMNLHTSDSIQNDIDEGYVYDPSYSENYSFEDIQIFEPVAYPQEEYYQRLFDIMDTIVGLFYIDERYELKKCYIEKVNVFENECTGEPLIEPTLNTNEQCLFLFKGINAQKNRINYVDGKLIVPPHQKKSFIFNNVSYEFTAEGKISPKSSDLRDYKLYMTVENKKQCIVEMKYFSDTMTEILFAGDIDGDGKADLIISSPDYYESSRIMLFLSSLAEKDELLKLVAITAYSFAC